MRVFLSESERRKQGVWIQDGSVWIQHGRIQVGCHHQVESEWMSEGYFCANGGNQSWQVWVSLRGKTKIAESKLAKFKMAEFKMAAIIKLIQNELVKFFLCKWWGGKWEWSFFFVQMGGTNPGKCEWVWEEKLRWLNPRWQNSRWLPSISWVRMNKFESDWISLSQESEWSESVFEWIWEKIRWCLNPRWQWLNPTW